MRTAWKLFLVFTVGLIAYDAFQDAMSGCAFDPAGATACHSCSCGPRLVTKVTAVAPLAPRPQPFAPYQASLLVSLLPKSIFHPPNASA